MEKVYRLLDWLDIDQAVDWLQNMTDTNLNQGHLLKLCSYGQCHVYANTEKVKGYAGDEFTKQVIGSGIQIVCNPMELIHQCGYRIPRDILFEGPVFLAGGSGEEEDLWEYWVAPQALCEPLFKPTDIEALATKMNGDQKQYYAVGLEATSKNTQAEEAKPEKLLHPSERKSVAQIIATLAAMAGLDLSTPYAADETLRAAAATHSLDLPSSPETVVKFLKDAAARAGKS